MAEAVVAAAGAVVVDAAAVVAADATGRPHLIGPVVDLFNFC
jgi:hypothetical protein